MHRYALPCDKKNKKEIISTQSYITLMKRPHPGDYDAVMIFVFDQYGNQVFQGCLAEECSPPPVPQDPHSPNGKPPLLEEVQSANSTLPCGKPKRPIEQTETVKDRQTLQSWILRSHFHQGRKHWPDCYRYYQENQPTVSELDGDIKLKPESIDKILETMKTMPSSEGFGGFAVQEDSFGTGKSLL